MSERVQPYLVCLNHQRRHILGILDGLTDEQLRTPVLPSGWSCVQLVHHLALDVEQFWFRSVMAGDSGAPIDDTPGDAPGWQVDPEVAPEAVLARYRDEIAAADRIITSTPLEAAPAAWPEDVFGDWRLPDLQAILLHVIAETACHAGHLDAVRELLDGRQWLTLG